MLTPSILPINNNNINNNDNNNNNDSNSNNDNNNNDDTKTSNQKIISTSSIFKSIEVSSYLVVIIITIVLSNSLFDYKLSPVSTAANSTQLLGIYLYMYITICMIITIIEFIKTHTLYLIQVSVRQICKIANGHYQPRGNNSMHLIILLKSNHHNLVI